MKTFTKLATAIAAASLCFSAVAAQVTLNPGDNAVIYNFETLNVDSSGNITIIGADYDSGTFPYGDLQCGDNTIEEDGVCIGIGGATGSSSSSSSAATSSVNSSSSSSSSSVADGSCPTPADNVVVEQSLFDWRTPTSQLTMRLSRDKIHAYPIDTSSNSQFEGQLSFVPFSNTGNVMKDMWISECPGGAPLPEGACHRSGLQTNIYWEQGQSSARCTIQPSSRFYFNVQNTGGCTMSAGCHAKVQHLYSGSPD